MSPERAQCDQDLGDSQTVGAGVVQLQWEAVDAFDAALKALAAWQTACINAEPETTRVLVGLECSHAYLAFKKLRPPAPLTLTFPTRAPADCDNHPYWAG